MYTLCLFVEDYKINSRSIEAEFKIIVVSINPFHRFIPKMFNTKHLICYNKIVRKATLFRRSALDSFKYRSELLMKFVAKFKRVEKCNFKYFFQIQSTTN